MPCAWVHPQFPTPPVLHLQPTALHVALTPSSPQPCPVLQSSCESVCGKERGEESYAYLIQQGRRGKFYRIILHY